MTILSAYQQLLADLSRLYDRREAATIADWVMEHITGKTKTTRLLQKTASLNEAQSHLWSQFKKELLEHKPVQYVLQEAWFAGMKLFVNDNVLIPRPETEELVEWIVQDLSGDEAAETKILDIGTGSGCIPIALKRKSPAAHISAVDISPKALHVAKQNALSQQAFIDFMELNILNKSEWDRLSLFDVIVSNPPYIKQCESQTMENNVLNHEPHIALFVQDEDALLFYRIIAEFGQQHLNANGKLFFEINETMGKEVCRLLEGQGFTAVELKKDLQGKDRMVKALKRNLKNL